MPHQHWQHPHYWNHYYKRYSMFCGPSRLVWFAFGSVATWAWIRHQHQGAACPPRVGYGYNAGHRAQWERERDQSPINNNAPASSSPGGRGDFGQWRPTTQPQSQPQPQPQPQTQSESMTPMDRNHERLPQIGRNAEETISDMSEATIDSMMSVLQRLKDRLDERRTQQQLQEIGPQQVNPTPATSPGEPTGPRHRV